MKYELLPTETSLYRLRALKDFGDVKKGDLGGLVSGESNIGIWGDCWIDNTCCVINGCMVRDNAQVLNGSIIYDRVVMGNESTVSSSVLGSYLQLSDNAFVHDVHIVEQSPHFTMNAKITSRDDWCMFSGFGRDITAFRQKNNSIGINFEYFRGSLSEFEEQFCGREYQKIIELIKIKFEV